METEEIIEAPRRSWAWAFVKVVVLGVAVSGLSYGGALGMSWCRDTWPIVKAEASTTVWETYDRIDNLLVSDHELIEMYSRRAGGSSGFTALVTGIIRTVPGAATKSCIGYDRRGQIECEVQLVISCAGEQVGKQRADKLRDTLGCLGGVAFQTAAMREVSEMLIEEKV